MRWSWIVMLGGLVHARPHVRLDVQGGGEGEAKVPTCAKKGEPRRVRRYVLNSHVWTSRVVTWRLSDPHSLFINENDMRTVHDIIAHTLYTWSRAAHETILFDELTADDTRMADIEIYFAIGAHNDFEEFDGEGGIVAHSAYPEDGQVHFDAAENWTSTGKSGVDLRYVAMHEIGHALGLRHSPEPSAVMNPVYRASSDIRLGTDDVRGVQMLYPMRTHTSLDRRETSKEERKERRKFGRKE